MRFDWYQATILDNSVALSPLETVNSRVASELGSVDLEVNGGRWGYASEAVWRGADGEVVARMMYGGNQPWPNAWASGSASPAFADLLRASWNHRVSRVDSAIDWDGEGAWDRLCAIALELADERRLAVSQAGDWHRCEAGRTLYVGSRSSRVYMRLYEKGIQLGGSPNWVRAELQVRPMRDTRYRVAGMSAEDVWGLSVWSVEMLRRLTGAEVERVVMKTGGAGDDARALETIKHQYGGVLGRLRARLGSDEAVGRYLMQAIDAAS